MGILFLILALLLPLIFGPLRNGIQNVVISIVLLLVYVSISISIGITTEEIFYDGSWVATVPGIIFLTMLVTGICYAIERGKTDSKQEDFYDERLFYKYGQVVKADVLPIGASKGKTSKTTEELARNLYHHLTLNMREKFGDNQQFNTKLISVSDSNKKSDARIFMKMHFLTMRKSSLTYFVTLKNVGNQLAINSLAYIKSNYAWHAALLYIVGAPFHYWFWIYHWLMGKYAISSRLGMIYTGNSFDKLDLESFLKAATFTIMGSIEDFAKENNLLTEELKQTIVNNINNTQNIQIEKSKGVRIGKMKIVSSPSYVNKN
ncbi:MAG: hypothetical protein AAGG68_06240 [Bacteroidota bacterium]